VQEETKKQDPQMPDRLERNGCGNSLGYRRGGGGDGLDLGRLCRGGSSGRGRRSSSSYITISRCPIGHNGRRTIGFSGSAIFADVSRLAALVARLSGGVQGTSIGSGAVARDVAQFATGIALHGLRLAIAGIVVGSATFVARRGAVVGHVVTPAKTSTATVSATTATSRDGSSSRRDGAGRGTVTGQVTDLAARVAAAGGGTAADAQGRTVGLDVAQTLAMITLFRLGRARHGALVGLVARLLAVVTQPLRRGADLGIVTDIATLVARAAGKRRHLSINGILSTPSVPCSVWTLMEYPKTRN